MHCQCVFVREAEVTTGQLPMSENSLALEFTGSRLVHVLYHSWALPTSVKGRPTTFANTSTQNSKFSSPFSLFCDSSTKSSEKAPCAQKRLTPSRDWVKLITNKTFTKWDVQWRSWPGCLCGVWRGGVGWGGGVRGACPPPEKSFWFSYAKQWVFF